MNGILESPHGNCWGKVGELTSITYFDGSNAKVGDIVQVFSDTSDHGESYICSENGKEFVMGIANYEIRNGISDSYKWHICKKIDSRDIKDGYKDSKGVCAVIKGHTSEITDGMKDRNGITTIVKANNDDNIIKSEKDLIYCFVSKGNVPFENRKYIEQMINIGVIQICANHFISAKIINKKTGEVINLLQ